LKNLSLENIISATGGKFVGDTALLGREISAVTTDSRQVSKDCLFAAIKGERVDGHDFISSAFKSGALCVLAEHLPEGELGGAVILVSDTVEALGALAGFYRGGFDIPIIGVTGSVGKTTAKEMLSHVLEQRFRVHKTLKNLNNNLGVPLTLFGLDDSYEAAVVEMGISHFGEMSQLGRMVRPKYALYTSIGAAHLEFLGDYDGVLRAKTEMLEYLAPDGAVFINGDDPTLRKLSCTRRIVSFGLGEGCDVRAVDVKLLGAEGTEFTVTAGDRAFRVKTGSFGLHMVTAALGAAAIGMELGLMDREIAEGIAQYSPVGGRSALERTEKLTIINDCYNANPTSVMSALDSLALLPCTRRVAVLGDMLELGEKSAELHRECGEHAAVKGIDVVVTTGELSLNTYEGAMETGCPDAMHFGTREELIAALPSIVREGDAVLVKASHSRKFDEIVEGLRRL